ncbi:MAG: SDR family NAD(P)-dependent oxidoreductase [Actinomycetota bacterium]|nr:SDR family NAD(P)-dependent oxidoreductase [Actinomycetota bacterium]
MGVWTMIGGGALRTSPYRFVLVGAFAGMAPRQRSFPVTRRRELARPLRDQVVVITGASSGIGRQTPCSSAGTVRQSYWRRGTRRLSTAPYARSCASAATRWPSRPTCQSGGRVQALADRAVEQFGRIDTWVNNAA